MIALSDFHLRQGPDGIMFLDKEASTLDELLSYRAVGRPDQKQFAILGDGENVTQEMTAREAHDWASRVAGLLRRFLPERSRVLLCFENSMEAVAGFFGCAYANMIPISGVYPAAVGSRERLFNVLEDSKADAVIGLRQTLLDFRRQTDGQVERTSVKWIPIEGAEQAEPLYDHHVADLDDTALIQYTSGSVGLPRGVKITHRSLGANLSLLLERLGVHPEGLGLSWLPLSHDMGLMIGLMIPLAVGGPCWFMLPQHFIEKPERWVKAISRYRIGFSAGPNFAYELCAHQVSDETVKELDLSCWSRSVIGAEMIEYDAVNYFFRRFEPAGLKKSVLRPGYGMAEVTLMISSGGWEGHEVVSFEKFSRSALAQQKVESPQNEDDVRILASCGKAIQDHTIAVVDPETGEPVPDGCVGELWLSGPSVSPGYLDREEENKERFGRTAEGYSFFRSRDAGFFHEGELYVVGRLENRVMLDGRFFDPDDLANVVRVACPIFKGRSLAIFRHHHELCVVGEVDSTVPEAQYRSLLWRAARALTKVCPMRALWAVLVRPGGISRTPSGKIRLSATRDALLDHKLPILEERRFDDTELGSVEVLERPEMKL